MMCVEISVCLYAEEVSPRPPARRGASAGLVPAGSGGGCWFQSGRLPWVAMAGSQAWPVVMTACRCRRIAATMTVWAWVGRSLLCSQEVRCAYLAA